MRWHLAVGKTLSFLLEEDDEILNCKSLLHKDVLKTSYVVSVSKGALRCGLRARRVAFGPTAAETAELDQVL